MYTVLREIWVDVLRRKVITEQTARVLQSCSPAVLCGHRPITRPAPKEDGSCTTPLNLYRESMMEAMMCHSNSLQWSPHSTEWTGSFGGRLHGSARRGAARRCSATAKVRQRAGRRRARNHESKLVVAVRALQMLGVCFQPGWWGTLGDRTLRHETSYVPANHRTATLSHVNITVICLGSCEHVCCVSAGYKEATSIPEHRLCT